MISPTGYHTNASRPHRRGGNSSQQSSTRPITGFTGELSKKSPSARPGPATTSSKRKGIIKIKMGLGGTITRMVSRDHVVPIERITPNFVHCELQRYTQTCFSSLLPLVDWSAGPYFALSLPQQHIRLSASIARHEHDHREQTLRRDYEPTGLPMSRESHVKSTVPFYTPVSS